MQMVNPGILNDVGFFHPTMPELIFEDPLEGWRKWSLSEQGVKHAAACTALESGAALDFTQPLALQVVPQPEEPLFWTPGFPNAQTHVPTAQWKNFIEIPSHNVFSARGTVPDGARGVGGKSVPPLRIGERQHPEVDPAPQYAAEQSYSYTQTSEVTPYKVFRVASPLEAFEGSVSVEEEGNFPRESPNINSLPTSSKHERNSPQSDESQVEAKKSRPINWTPTDRMEEEEFPRGRGVDMSRPAQPAAPTEDNPPPPYRSDEGNFEENEEEIYENNYEENYNEQYSERNDDTPHLDPHSTMLGPRGGCTKLTESYHKYWGAYGIWSNGSYHPSPPIPVPNLCRSNLQDLRVTRKFS